jgi:CPA2 family monovalent cation:H+ antiporter-2
VDEILPGLGSVAELHVEPGTRAAGATLGALDLRGRTGAGVVAIRRGADSLTNPTGSTQLQAGDVLAVAGTHEALAAAAALLRAPAGAG